MAANNNDKVVELRCDISYNLKTTTDEEIRDSKNSLLEAKEPKNEESSEKIIQYIKITYDDNKYFKISFDRTVYSTKSEENKFNGWSINDIDVEFKNLSDENRIAIVADIKSIKRNDNSFKDGWMKLLQRIDIDRISGKYKEYYMAESQQEYLRNNGKKIVNTTVNISNVNGICEKFTRKF